MRVLCTHQPKKPFIKFDYHRGKVQEQKLESFNGPKGYLPNGYSRLYSKLVEDIIASQSVLFGTSYLLIVIPSNDEHDWKVCDFRSLISTV